MCLLQTCHPTLAKNKNKNHTENLNVRVTNKSINSYNKEIIQQTNTMLSDFEVICDDAIFCPPTFPTKSITILH